MTPRKAQRGGAEAPISAPWSLRIGKGCSFYHEGGRGEKHWVCGWRYGVILEVPSKGQHKGWVRVEIPVKLYSWDESKGYQVKPFERAWVHEFNVNAPGDTVYHGLSAREVYAERKAEKAKQQAKIMAQRKPPGALPSPGNPGKRKPAQRQRAGH